MTVSFGMKLGLIERRSCYSGLMDERILNASTLVKRVVVTLRWVLILTVFWTNGIPTRSSLVPRTRSSRSTRLYLILYHLILLLPRVKEDVVYIRPRIALLGIDISWLASRIDSDVLSRVAILHLRWALEQLNLYGSRRLLLVLDLLIPYFSYIINILLDHFFVLF